MRGPSTLRHRLALVAVLTTAAWVIALTVLFNVMLDTQLHSQANSVLRTRAQAALSTVEVGKDGSLKLRETPNDAALDAGIWVFEGSIAVDRAQARPAVQKAADRLAAARRGTFTDVSGNPEVRLFAQPIRHAGRQVGTVVSATSIEAYLATSRIALLASVALGLLLIIGVYLVTRRVVAGALAPVVEMADQAARWSAHDVGQRFGAAPRPAELRDLAAGLDALLDRIGAVLRHEKQLAAELSHELRTPLSVVAAETELLRDSARTDEERARAYEVIADTTTRMDSLLDTLLTQAAQDVTDAPGRCAVEDVVQAAVAAAGTDLRVNVDVVRGLEVGASAEVVERILAQLLGNALRFATGSITVTGRHTAQGVSIVVSDDGPGVPAEFRSRVFEPGQRAEPGDGHPGSGLGLALARRLARSAGGDIVLRDTDRGAAFAVLLPA
jgi:signal transduction histidine kinase